MAVFDWGRNEIDKTVRVIGEEFWTEAVALSDLFVKEAKKIAKKRGVSPGYLLFALGHDLAAAKRRAGPNGKGLGIAWHLKANRGRDPGVGFSIPPGSEGEQAVDEAIQDLALWSATDFKKELGRAFVRVVNKHAPRLKAELDAQDIQSKPISVVLHELPLRTRDHPFWFQAPSDLYRIVTWFSE